MRTADATGTKVADFLYSPFGQVLATSYNNLVTPNTPQQAQPYNAYTYTSFSWVGKNQKFDEASFVLTPIQMGARVYIPGIGRFLSVDLQEGGGDNNYVYPGDPVNEFDLDGNFSWGHAIKIATRVATVGSMIPGPIGMVASGVAVAGNLAQGNYGAAAVASIGLLGGVGSVARLGSMAAKSGGFAKTALIASKGASKFENATLVRKVVTAQARLPLVGKSSKLFGTGSAKGILNSGSLRIGWSKDKSLVSWRVGLSGSHNVLTKIKTFTKWKGYK